jgi:hypothetical protein
VLSDKTDQSHLTRVYAELEVRSRSEVGACFLYDPLSRDEESRAVARPSRRTVGFWARLGCE